MSSNRNEFACCERLSVRNLP